MFRESLRFLGKLTLPKVINLLLIRLSYLLSVLLKRPVVWGMPFFISIEPASICNLECPQCPVGKGDIKRQNKLIDDLLYKGLLDKLSPKTLVANLSFQGEPLMNKYFHKLVKIANNKGLFTICSTNGQLLTDEVALKLVQSGLDRIIISVDGIDQESYSKYRRSGYLSNVIRGIRALSDARKETGKKSPRIIVQFLVFKHNQNQVGQIKDLGKMWGADKVRIKSSQIEYQDTATEWLPEKAKYRRYAYDETGELILKRKLRNHCRRIWETSLITTDGIVVPCCFDKRAEFSMGSILESGIESIWKNEDYMNFRKKVLRQRSDITICKNCTEGLGNIFIS
jgi:radical SAM protein with 4Fe4S-binding SPASM domain